MDPLLKSVLSLNRVQPTTGSTIVQTDARELDKLHSLVMFRLQIKNKNKTKQKNEKTTIYERNGHKVLTSNLKVAADAAAAAAE